MGAVSHSPRDFAIRYHDFAEFLDSVAYVKMIDWRGAPADVFQKSYHPCLDNKFNKYGDAS